MTGQIVEVEAMAAVSRLMRDAEHRREGGVLGKADGPLVEGAVGVFGDHQDAGGEDAETQAVGGGFALTQADQSGGRVGQTHGPLTPVLNGQVHVFVAGVHHNAATERVGVTGGEGHGNS